MLINFNKDNIDILNLGVNVVIDEIDLENKILTVSNIEKETFKIDCIDTPIIYYNYINNKIKDIRLEDLKLGDEIALNIYNKEFNIINKKIIKAKQIQLLTQKLN